MKLFKALTLLSASFSILVASEPSAFGAGDLNNPNPYGLTKTESTILETKKDLQKINAKSNNQANQVDSLRERLDGLQSIIENISQSSYALKTRVTSLEEKSNKDGDSASEYNKRLTELLQEQSSMIQKNRDDIAKINQVLKEISKTVDSINSSYVSKDDIKKAPAQTQSTSDKKKESSASKVDVENEAAKAYRDKKYDIAKEKYQFLADGNYKPAKANYMLGEIEYYQKRYSNAIAYFKKSASIASDTEFMPVLMLHSAISMDESGDKANAQNFYKALVEKYPNSNEAKMAKKKIK